MYVGGIFGKLNTNQIEMEMGNSSTVQIRLYTDSSYYIGGFVGKLEFTNNSSNAGTFLGDIPENYEITSGGKDSASVASNMGGFIGLLKLPTTSNTFTANVQGTHYYPFTINTIEDSN